MEILSHNNFRRSPSFYFLFTKEKKENATMLCCCQTGFNMLCVGRCCGSAMCATRTELPSSDNRCSALSYPSCSGWTWRHAENYRLICGFSRFWSLMSVKSFRLSTASATFYGVIHCSKYNSEFVTWNCLAHRDDCFAAKLLSYWSMRGKQAKSWLGWGGRVLVGLSHS